MSKRYYRTIWIEILAFFHQYLFPILLLLSPIIAKKYSLLVLGCGFLFYAAYSVIGYYCRWKHIFCAWQLAHRQAMTPNDIRWHMIRKADLYSLTAVFAVMGVALIGVHLYGFWLNS